MAQGQPEKPWKNTAPKPDPDRRLTLDPRNIGSVEKTGPGVEYLFDADRAMIDEVAPSNDIKGLVEKLKGADAAAAKALFAGFGQELMETVAATGAKRKDRAWEMIEICARQTGLPFPHVLQVYVELFTLCSRPIDQWAIMESHPKKMRIQQNTCSYFKAQEEAGLTTSGLPCQALCLSAFETASGISEVEAAVELTKQLPVDNICEFTFTPK